MKIKLIFAAWPYLYTIPGLHNVIPILRADIFARWSRLKGDDVLFVTGYDEYGTRIELMAHRTCKNPQDIVDKLFPVANECMHLMHISANIVMRSTNPLHFHTAQNMMITLQNKGWLFKKKAIFAFDETDQKILPDRFVEGICPYCGGNALGDQCKQCGRLLSALELINPHSTISGRSTGISETDEWYLDLPRITQELTNYYANQDWSSRVNRVTAEFLDTVEPFVCSRHLDWGIQFPGDDKRVIYNWIESVIGDVSAVQSISDQAVNKYWKSPECESYFFMGKDNIPFFTILLPSLLWALDDGYMLPKNMVENDFLLFDGEVCSKISGKGVRINEAITMLEPDYWRFLIASMFGGKTQQNDFNFTWQHFAKIINRDLVMGVNRFVKTVYDTITIQTDLSNQDRSEEYNTQGVKFLDTLDRAIENHDFRQAVTILVDMARTGAEIRQVSITSLLGRVKSFAIVVRCILPYTSERIWQLFGFDDGLGELSLEDAKLCLVRGVQIDNISPIDFCPLFKRTTAKLLELDYNEAINRSDITTLRGIGELCPCEGWHSISSN